MQRPYYFLLPLDLGMSNSYQQLRFQIQRVPPWWGTPQREQDARTGNI
ncbi:MAG: hypothetical protein F6K24_35770 [Okeania sp. SIO2D1]|nr:hypothetical protein [Okeania sp. SIO2D1]